jgi:hypothetical protein
MSTGRDFAPVSSFYWGLRGIEKQLERTHFDCVPEAERPGRGTRNLAGKLPRFSALGQLWFRLRVAQRIAIKAVLQIRASFWPRDLL